MGVQRVDLEWSGVCVGVRERDAKEFHAASVGWLCGALALVPSRCTCTQTVHAAEPVSFRSPTSVPNRFRRMEAFRNDTRLKGQVYDFKEPYWRVRYSDGNWEDLTRTELQKIKRPAVAYG